MQYRCKDDDVLDLIVYNYYGEQAVKNGAVEYVLDYNQNLSREPIKFYAGLLIELPELPSSMFQPAAQSRIKVFENIQ
jgi:phage tail protein X